MKKKFSKLHRILGDAMNQLEAINAKELEGLPEPSNVDTLKHSVDFTEEQNFGLPLPRLEIRSYVVHTPSGRNEDAFCVYYLVERHYTGTIRATCKSWTKAGNAFHYAEGKPFEPRRDSVHMRYDMHILNLPGFFTHESGQIVLATNFKTAMGYEPKCIS